MNICFWCDLHLPSYKNALQYEVFRWALNDIKNKNADCLVFAGDVTCDGNIDVYKDFLASLKALPMKVIYIPGNSDLRDNSSKKEILSLSSPCKNSVGNINIYALNDAGATVFDEDIKAVEEADENSIVFMHHPIDSLLGESRLKMTKWREAHPKTMLFYAHCHKSFQSGNSVSLQAMDPDKAIGESPCITYFNTDSGELSRTYYYCPVPTDIYNYFGISCYKASRQIKYATEKGLKAIELRPGFLSENQEELKNLIDNWRKMGGENLSIHLPDIAYANGEVQSASNFNDYIKAAIGFKADRFTQHVPKLSVGEAREDKNATEKIAKFLGKHFDLVEHNMVIGIENMHMTQAEESDNTRRFGYIPEECLEFMELVSKNCRHIVGINFDIGHARNNAPFSQKYQIGTWLSMLGKHIVGYHIHQVTLDAEGFHNHCAIDHVYGRLISYASFFRLWSKGTINKAPIVFEMSKEGAYDITLATFEKQRQRIVSDFHSHTYYSNCGKDTIHNLVQTAIENGISVLGISDHNYGIGNRKKEYLAEVRSASEKYKDSIKILCGIEITTLPHNDIHTLDKIIGEFDYCLLENVSHHDSVVGENIFEYASKLGIPCIIAHTDLFAWCDEMGYDYTEFFKKMAENNIFWEMNVSYDSVHQYRRHSYVMDFINSEEKIDIIRSCGVRISIGFDSHACEEYDGFRVHRMYDILKSKGVEIVEDIKK